MIVSVNIKQQLHSACLDALNKRIEAAKYAMEQAQQSANSEEKSSAGDKYETGRAMSHHVRDMNAKQLQEALKDLAALKLINPDALHEKILIGSAVKTSGGNFYITVSAGQLKIENEAWFALSPAAPIAQSLLNKKKGDKFLFKGKEETILEVS